MRRPKQLHRAPRHLLALAGLVLAPAALQADELGSGTVSLAGRTTGNFSQMRLTIASRGFGGYALLFDEIVDPSVVGTTIVIDSGDAFDLAVELMTNGVEDRVDQDLMAPNGGAVGVCSPESVFYTFAGLPCQNGVDFQGAEVERIELGIDSFSITPSSNTRYDLDATLTVYGECRSGIRSSETLRLGSPPAPNAFMPSLTGAPAVGRVWSPWINHTTFAPNAYIDFVLVSTTPANFVSAFGTVLCDPAVSSRVLSRVMAAGGFQPFAIHVPNDPNLVGLSLCAQAGSVVFGSKPQLANALDLTVGSF